MQLIRYIPALCVLTLCLLLSVFDSGSMMRSPIGPLMFGVVLLVFWLPLRLVKDADASAQFVVGLGSYFLGQFLLGLAAWAPVPILNSIFSRATSETVTVVSSSKGSFTNKGHVDVWTDMVLRLPNGHLKNYHKTTSEDHSVGEKLPARIRTGPIFETIELI